MKLMILLFSCIFSTLAFAEKAAMVKMLKGEVFSIKDGKKLKLKQNDWLEEGVVIKTEAKSFVRLVFIDKSLMNISPSSELKIERFDNKDAGVLGLIRGKIRSQVSKDYLQIEGKDRSKLFIKTSNAVMGIRGTDFLLTTNGRNTAAILFEGEVVFNRLADTSLSDSQKLDNIVDSGVRLFPGEFSAVGMGAPTLPAILNVNQRLILERDKPGFDDKGGKQKSIVPPGLSASNVLNRPSVIRQDPDRPSSNAASFVINGQIKPVNGSLVDLENGVIVAPGADATYDATTNTFVTKDTTLNVESSVFTGQGPGSALDKSGSVTDTFSSTSTSTSTSTFQTVTTSPTQTKAEQIVYTAEDYKAATGTDYFKQTERSTTGTSTTTTGIVLGGVTSGGSTNGLPTMEHTLTGGTFTGGMTTGGTLTGGMTTGGTLTGGMITGGITSGGSGSGAIDPAGN